MNLSSPATGQTKSSSVKKAIGRMMRVLIARNIICIMAAFLVAMYVRGFTKRSNTP